MMTSLYHKIWDFNCIRPILLFFIWRIAPRLHIMRGKKPRHYRERNSRLEREIFMLNCTLNINCLSFSIQSFCLSGVCLNELLVKPNSLHSSWVWAFERICFLGRLTNFIITHALLWGRGVVLELLLFGMNPFFFFFHLTFLIMLSLLLKSKLPQSVESFWYEYQ